MRIYALPFIASVFLSPCVFAETPAIDLAPSKTPVTAGLDFGPLVREGTRYISRIARLIRSSNGQQTMLTFDDAAGVKTPVMFVQPNLNLFSMEGVMSAKGAGVQFRVSGTVTEYKGHNYILIDKAQTTLAAPMIIRPVVVAPATTSLTHADQTTQQPEPKPSTTTLAASSSMEQTMNRLLAPMPITGDPLPPPASNEGPATDRTTGNAAVAPAAPVMSVVREDTHLVNRVGRLSHTPDGKQAIFTFDADGKAMKDPPMVILPNAKLEAMEWAVLSRSSDVHFRVSGTLTEYKGRNFIQLDKAVIMPDVETQF